MNSKVSYYRLSISEPSLAELAQHLTSIKQGAGSLSRGLQEVLTKTNVMLAKIGCDAISTSHVASNAPRSAAGKLAAIDEDSYLMTYGNPEEKAAVEAAMMHIIETGMPSNWQDHMPSLEDRMYPATKIPGSEGEL